MERASCLKEVMCTQYSTEVSISLRDCFLDCVKMLSRGGQIIDWETSVMWWTYGGWRAKLEKGEAGILNLYASRHILESAVRDRVEKNKAIEIRYEMEVVDLLTDAKDKSHITGVKVANKVDNSFLDIDADLTVDCSGMLSPIPKILEKTGFTVRRTNVKSHLQYATTHLRFNGENPPYSACYFQPMAPDIWYGCIIWKIQQNEFLCTAIAINKNIPEQKIPTQKEEYLQFLEKFPEIHEWFVKAESVTGAYTYNKEGNQYNFYEDLSLHGLIALGDAVCNFNPAYGQGITTAAESVLLLDDLLRKTDYKRGFCKQFQTRLSIQLTVPWLLAVLSDLRFKGTETDNSFLTKLLPASEILLVKLLDSGSRSKLAYNVFLQVLHQKEGYIWKTLDPRFIWAVLTK